MCVVDDSSGRTDYAFERDRLLRRHAEKRAQEQILRYLSGFRAKREYRITLRCVIFVQAAARGRMCRREFLRWKRNHRRPYKIVLKECRGLNGVLPGQDIRVLVIITDNLMRRQLHRFDSSQSSYGARNIGVRDRDPRGDGADAAQWHEEFIVPGTSQDIHLVVMAVRSDDVFLGQAHMSMRASNFLLRASPEVTRIELQLGDLVVDPKQLATKCTHQKETRLHDGLVPTGRISLDFVVPHSLYSTCGVLTGPHIDVMRQGSANLPLSGHQGRRGRWWGCVVQGRLNLYRSQDESIPSQQIQIRRVDFMECRADAPPGFVLVMVDKRRWSFEVQSKSAAKRWLYAMKYWKLALRPLEGLRSPEVDLLSSIIVSMAQSGDHGSELIVGTGAPPGVRLRHGAVRLDAVRAWLAAILDTNF